MRSLTFFIQLLHCKKNGYEQVFDFVLSAREIELLNGLDKNERSFLFEIFGG